VVRITELNGFPLKLSGENPAILVFHKDVYGVIAGVASNLAMNKINISGMNVSRVEKGDVALMTIETDQPVSKNLINAITNMEHIIRVITLSE
jgi:L-serine dehydratase